MTMTTDRNQSCEARIAEHLAGRDEMIAELGARRDHDDDEVRDEAMEELWELPLSVETTMTVRVLLSTGGPADGLNVELDRDGNVSRVVYWFADWFDYAETVVTDENSALYRYAVETAELAWEVEAER